MSTNALVIKNTGLPGSLRRRILEGDQVRDKIRAVIEGRFRHRNDDDSIFVPRISASFVCPGVAQVIVIDPQRLWHFSIPRMTNEDTLAAMAVVVGRQVRAIRKLPTPNGDTMEVLAYAIMLNDQIGRPKAGAIAKPRRELPKLADMEFLKSRPDGDYMLGLGVGRDGQPVWLSLLDMGHVILAGSTGSGKSSGLRSLMYQFAKCPQPVELYLCDMEDKTFPWAIDWPIVKEYCYTAERATAMTAKVFAEMEHRSELFRSLRSRGQYPEDWAKYRELTGHALPWIVVVFEEVSALADQTGRHSKFMHDLRQLAMRARKYGITLIMSGQDFKADLISTSITYQFKTRIAFRCQTQQQSVSALGEAGAETLKRPGHAMVKLNGPDSMTVDVMGFWVPPETVWDVGGAGEGQSDVGSERLTDMERRLVRAALEKPDVFHGGFQQDTLASLFDRPDPVDGGSAITARQIRFVREGFIRKGLIEQRRGMGKKYWLTDGLIEMAMAV